MLPGYTHNIINISDTENLVTVMYCNEKYDPNKPDTFFEKVIKQSYILKTGINISYIVLIR